VKPAITAFTAAALTLVSTSAFAITDVELQATIQQRLSGDRTGACMAVAVVEQEHVARTFTCANPDDAGRIDAASAFEIGSVSKTMTAALLAEWIVRGEASLDDPLADWLPEGTVVPEFDGQPMLLRHIVTHTSGLPPLPPGMAPANPADPYADLSEDALLAALAEVTLEAAPGTQFTYSNFASMVLSSAVARRAGTDFETLIQQRLFAPLGMDSAYIGTPREGIRAAVGHTPNAAPAPAWHFATNLAGVGGVRATLDDMVGYVQGLLGWTDAAIAPALELAQQPVSDDPPFAMNWMLAPLGGRSVRVHEGGTGGFSAFVAVDHERQRGAVILSDTAWHSIGGLSSLGLHLLDDTVPMGAPRKLAAPLQELLDGLVGDYQVQGLKLTLRQRDGRLFVQAEGQDELEMAHDDAGDFFPLVFDATLRPQRGADGTYSFLWIQGGGALPATRIAADDDETPAPAAASTDDFEAYAGRYPLMRGFALTVRVRRGQLEAQATGQGAFPLQAKGGDRFAAPAFGIEIQFKRDAAGQVESLDLYQGGHVLSGQRQ